MPEKTIYRVIAGSLEEINRQLHVVASENVKEKPILISAVPSQVSAPVVYVLLEKTLGVIALFAMLSIAPLSFGQGHNNTLDPVNGFTQTWVSGAAIRAGQILKFDVNSPVGADARVVPVDITDTRGAMGIAVTGTPIQGDGKGQTVIVNPGLGTPAILLDGPCSIGDSIVISPTLRGWGHCTSSPTGQVLGIAIPGTTQSAVPISPSYSARRDERDTPSYRKGKKSLLSGGRDLRSEHLMVCGKFSAVPQSFSLRNKGESSDGK